MEMGYKESRWWGKAKNGVCGKAHCPTGLFSLESWLDLGKLE